MHNAVKRFIREVREDMPYKFRFRRVLEVGSHNINGSPRRYFWFCAYTGIDITSGRGVDRVSSLAELKIDDQYQVVLSTEMLEHDEDWQASLLKMYQVLEDNGLLLITCAGPERKEHGTKKSSPECSPDTTDYYRNISKKDFKKVLPPSLFTEYDLRYARGENDLQFCGIKKRGPTSKEIYSKLKENFTLL